jgi:hypothetical protein
MIKHTRSIEEYHTPTYIDKFEKNGKIKKIGKEFIKTSEIWIDLENNLIRAQLDGEKSEDTINKLVKLFDRDGGWNPHLGPCAVVMKYITPNGELKYRPLGFTHRCRASEDVDLYDIPAVIIQILDTDPTETITDLYVSEQSYERIPQYDETLDDVTKSLYRWKSTYEQKNPGYKVEYLEKYLGDKISDFWDKDSDSTSMKKLIGSVVGKQSTYSVTNYSTTSLAQNFIDKKYNGESVWNTLGKISKNIKFSINSSKTVAQQIIENDGTFYKPIFIYDDLLRRDWFTVQEMAGELLEDKSKTKIMLFVGIGGGQIPTNETIESRRRTMIKRLDFALDNLKEDVRDYILIGGWLPSDTDSELNSILDYGTIRREVNK